MARKAAVLDQLDEKLDYGSLSGLARKATPSQPTALTPDAEARILGTRKIATRQTAAQMADQNSFDAAFGFTPTHPAATSPPRQMTSSEILESRSKRLAKDPYDLDYGTGGFGSDQNRVAVAPTRSAPLTVPVTPVRAAPLKVNPLNGVAALPADPFRDISFDSRPPADPLMGPATLPPAPVPAPVAPPTTAETLGRQVRATGVKAANTLADVAITQPIAAATAAGNQIGNTFSQLANQYIRKPLSYAGNIAGDFTKGLTTPGQTPAGVTNATAAQFTTPTKDNPVPQTDTSPDSNIDRSQSSLARFGLSEDAIARKKKLFAGF